MFSIATLPTSTDFIADIGEWSSPFFSDLLPFAVFGIGILLGMFLIRYLINIAADIAKKK